MSETIKKRDYLKSQKETSYSNAELKWHYKLITQNHPTDQSKTS